MDENKTVSYTHLDVYKRQDQYTTEWSEAGKERDGNQQYSGDKRKYV